MSYPLVRELAADGVPVAVTCRVLGVSTSGFYDWRDRAPSARQRADQKLTEHIRAAHAASRCSYGSPRIHAELRLGLGIRCGRKRIERLMRAAGLVGIYRRRRRGCTVRDPHASPAADLVNRRFVADRPDALWVCDITQHRTGEGWLYLAVVVDVFSRRVVGWSIGERATAELVVDALELARWRRRPPGQQTIVHSDHGSQYTSWAFGQRLRATGLLASMGSIGDCFDNSLVESFFGTLQLELLDRQQWTTRAQLATAIFEWVEAWYNPTRRHSSIDNMSPIDYELLHTAATDAA